MKSELYPAFNQVCLMAQEIANLPDLDENQIEKVFSHVSNVDMETTIRTIRYAYHMVKQETEYA